MRHSHAVVAAGPSRVTAVGLYGLILTALLPAGCGQSPPDSPAQHEPVPILQREVSVVEGGDTLQPQGVRFVDDTLYVIYNGEARLDLFTPNLEKIRTVFLDQPEPLYPVSFSVSEAEIYFCERATGEIAVYGRDGRRRGAFRLLPGRVASPQPVAMTHFGKVLYIATAAEPRLLAVSASETSVMARGELILAIPPDTVWSLGRPSMVEVSAEGQLLLGDAQAGLLRVVGFDGRLVSTFAEAPVPRPMAPRSVAYDNVMARRSVRTVPPDAGGKRAPGRIHVVDGNNAQVHLFNSAGEYLTSYPPPGTLLRPSGIAIDTVSARIYIADPRAARIFIYTYQK